ncbi:DNA-directed RNA polymerase V subunit 5C [Striga hermonthica]|uniref:DNA-directed RNA polymerase V subunit 5C n=1 Tax=Striga hermonthica TaxID=68872 RepID=A0A9N7N1X8_STRHE|nr:DNA-directed RNA polymerase V subunit 5C [Striga hermonthica]
MADESSKFADGRNTCISMQMHAGSLECRRYYMARRTLLEMLRDRGYTVANMEAELHRSLPDFRAEYGDKPEPKKLSLIAASATDSSRKIHAIFCEPMEIRKATMNFILGQILNKEQLDKVILILQSKMNSHALKVVEEHSITNVKVETFQITELLVNITKHVLMPKLEILNSEEKEKLLKKHNIQDKQLPMMLENDAMARYYGCEKGQVVKVTYSGSTTGTIVTYRCVDGCISKRYEEIAQQDCVHKSDVWALGCSVLPMPPRVFDKRAEPKDVLFKIEYSDHISVIPHKHNYKAKQVYKGQKSR